MKKALFALFATLAFAVNANATTQLETEQGHQTINGVYLYNADTLLWTTDNTPFDLLSVTLTEQNPWSPGWDNWVDEWAYVTAYRNGAQVFHRDVSVQFGQLAVYQLDFFNVDTVVFNSGAISDGTRLQVVGLTGVGISEHFAPAIPEPETYAMLLAGLGLMGAVSRRRKGVQA